MPDKSCSQEFAYQPILSKEQASVAIALRYRISSNESIGEDEALRAANTIINAFIHSGLDDLLRHRLAFIPVTWALLDSDLLKLLPAERIALELSCPEELNEKCLERCSELRSMGYTLVLDDFDESLHMCALLDSIDIVSLDAKALQEGRGAATLDRLRQCPVKLLVRGVDTQETFEALRHRGFDLYQGYYFAHFTAISEQRADPGKLAVLDIIARLEADEDDNRIEEAFKSNPALALQLLRLVNSSAFALRTKINSIKHAFAILGRRQLTRWLQVLLFALDRSDGSASPLMELALRRARFMEYVLIYRTHKSSTQMQDAAYLAGLLSLSDVLMGWPIAKIAERLNLADEIRLALLERSGPIGRLIVLCEKLEAADFDGANEIAAELLLPLEAVMTAQNEALIWAHGICSPASAEETTPEPENL